MGKWIFTLEDEKDEEFRRLIADIKGLKKGVIQESLAEAVDEWIKSRKKLKKSKR